MALANGKLARLAVWLAWPSPALLLLLLFLHPAVLILDGARRCGCGRGRAARL